MICSCCKLPIHPDQAEPRATVIVIQAGDRRHYPVCGGCLESRIEPQLTDRGGRAPIDLPLVTITR